jgi:hypothetical protein
MDYQEINKNISKFSVVIQVKIYGYVISNYLRTQQFKKKLKWYNNNYLYDDFNLICLFHNAINSNGYIKIEKHQLNYIYIKFPQIDLNPFIDIHHIKSMVNKCWFQLKFHYKKFKLLPSNPINHNIYLAGGFYTNYINGIFAKEFPIYFNYFIQKKDIDLYYDNARSPGIKYDKFYLKIKEFSSRFNLIVKRNNFATDVIDAFDFDCSN